MKFFYYIVVLALTTALSCPRQDPYPETPAGEFAYALCDNGEWGYRYSYCTATQHPIWVEQENICKSYKKLVHPPYGSNMVQYDLQITNFEGDFTAKHLYKVDYALFNITFEYVVKPIDVVVIGWEKDVNNTLTLKVHQRMDFVYRKEVIDNLVHWATDGTIINRLMELDDDFLNSEVIIDRNTFSWNSFNIFYNFYWDLILGTLLVSLIWWYLCKLGRKGCAKKAAKKEAEKKEEEKKPLI